MSPAQLSRLREGLQHVLATDNFTTRRLRQAGISHAEDVRSPDDFKRLPPLAREALVEDQAHHPPFGTNLVQPLEAYVTLSRSPGASGAPLDWLATREDASWLVRTYVTALEAIGVRADDIVLHVIAGEPVAWGWWAAAQAVGALCIASEQPAPDLRHYAPTVLVCTPGEAMRLVRAGTDVGRVRTLALWGEPIVPSTRRRIEDALGARCIDLYAMAELGAVGWECPQRSGTLHLNEEAFIAEVDARELILTPLGRWDMPLVRYRTGDRASLAPADCACGCTYVCAPGGIAGRVAQEVTVRGVTLLPSAVENVVRRHPAVAEFALQAFSVRDHWELSVQVEADPAIASEGDRARVAAEVSEDLRRSLTIRLACDVVPPGRLTDQFRGRRALRLSRQ